MKRIIKYLVVLNLVVNFLGAAYVSAATISAASCSQSDVQAAINASATGDKVSIPSGECTWTSAVSIPDAKKITLQGAGYDNTVISTSVIAIQMNLSGSRITGIGFILTAEVNSIINVKGTGWRIDNCKFNNTTGLSVVSLDINGTNVTQYPTGLVDNCVFINGRILVSGLGTFAKNSALWLNPINLGTADAVYVEDCNFSRNDGGRRNAIDGNLAGMCVFRYNTITDSYVELHGLQSDQGRAPRKFETYRNTLHSSNNQYLPLRYRGGTGVIFDNELSGDYNGRVIDFYLDRSFKSVGVAGMCDGTSSWDGNEDATGWPCRDGIGRGPDVYLFDKASPPYPRQKSVPAYLWLNRDKGRDGKSSNIASVIMSGGSGNHIKANRDFYNEVAGFDGTSGVGVGLLANRPATCKTGVAYWATDQGDWNKKLGGQQGVLYKCTAPNTWTLYYTPYTYPHPLIKAWSNLQPPKNPRISQ
ncbi:MAG: hypothetical protein KG012_00635 [Deltaproteobacteria bacterium]|nr:hypothetical protein [Deltaproteobacteria bacterium]